MPVVSELPTLSAKTVMNTRSSMLSKYIDAKQNRRRKAKYHQKRLKMGLPAAVPLKPVSLDQQEKEAIASTEAIGTARQKRLFVTKHFAWPVSLGVHVFAGFLITVYAITEYIPEPEPVSLDFVEPVRKARTIRRRSPIKPTRPPDNVQIRAPRVQRAPTAIEIPRDEAQFHTPTEDLLDAGAGPAAGGVAIPDGLGNIQVQQDRAEIPTEAPGVKIERDTSIAPEDSDLDIGADAGLGDRNIDVQVEVQVDQNPSVLRRFKPKYPEAARRANRETVVFVEFTVDVNGKAIDIKVADPKGFGFDEAAIEAIKKWRFTPAKKDGVSVPKRVRQPIRFNLDD
jgi:TonB family protein